MNFLFEFGVDAGLRNQHATLEMKIVLEMVGMMMIITM